MRIYSLLLLACLGSFSFLSSCGPREPAVTAYEPDFPPRYAYRLPIDYTPDDTSWALVVILHSEGKDEEEPLAMWDKGFFADSDFILLAIRGPFRFDEAYAWAPRPDSGYDSNREFAAALTVEQQVMEILADFEEQFSIDWEWRFLIGFPGAATAALVTGLRHPEVFQGVAAVAASPLDEALRRQRYGDIGDVDVFLAVTPELAAEGVRDSAALAQAGATVALFRQKESGVTVETLQEIMRFFGFAGDEIGADGR